MKAWRSLWEGRGGGLLLSRRGISMMCAEVLPLSRTGRAVNASFKRAGRLESCSASTYLLT